MTSLHETPDGFSGSPGSAATCQRINRLAASRHHADHRHGRLKRAWMSSASCCKAPRANRDQPRSQLIASMAHDRGWGVPRRLRGCYDAGPTGYALARLLKSWGVWG